MLTANSLVSRKPTRKWGTSGRSAGENEPLRLDSGNFDELYTFYVCSPGFPTFAEVVPIEVVGLSC